MKNLICLLILFFTVWPCWSETEKTTEPFPILTGPYFGQKLPGDKPEPFAPGIISTALYTRDMAITPDGKELYFSVTLANFTYSCILFSKWETNGWTKPEVAPFSGNPNVLDIEPAISADGKKFYFASNRSGNMDIWVMDRTNSGWGEPYSIGSPINTEKGEFFPSITANGTLYFTRDEPNGTNFIYRAALKDGKYSEPEKLSAEINSTKTQFNAFIAPDESYIIVPSFGRKDTVGSVDYYICFRLKENEWSQPINLGKEINTTFGEEYSPYVSPDGKYFFFMSTRFSKLEKYQNQKLTFDTMKQMYNEPGSGNPAIYWVSTSFIEQLKKEATPKNE